MSEHVKEKITEKEEKKRESNAKHDEMGRDRRSNQKNALKPKNEIKEIFEACKWQLDNFSWGAGKTPLNRLRRKDS